MDEEDCVLNIPRSPSMAKMTFQHKLDVDDEEKKNEYSLCCSKRKTDRRLLTFISLFSISVMVLSFSFYMLTTDLDCNQESVYVGLISMIVGIWMKSPL